MGSNITFSIFAEKTPPKNASVCPVKVMGYFVIPFIVIWQLNSKPWGTFTCIGVKIPSQVDSEPAMTGLKTESDKADESESGLQPEGGDDRYKVGILLWWAAGRISHRGEFLQDSSHDFVVSNARALRFYFLNPKKMEKTSIIRYACWISDCLCRISDFYRD